MGWRVVHFKRPWRVFSRTETHALRPFIHVFPFVTGMQMHSLAYSRASSNRFLVQACPSIVLLIVEPQTFLEVYQRPEWSGTQIQFSFRSTINKRLVKSKRMAMFLWFVTQHRLVGRHQCFGETYCLHLQNWTQKNNIAYFRQNLSLTKRMCWAGHVAGMRWCKRIQKFSQHLKER
jgi:hypothetical protein